MTKTSKETETAILKLISALITDAESNGATNIALAFQALQIMIQNNSHFDESYIEQLKLFKVPEQSEQKISN
jgi:hypothetical protein